MYGVRLLSESVAEIPSKEHSERLPWGSTGWCSTLARLGVAAQNASADEAPNAISAAAPSAPALSMLRLYKRVLICDI